MQVERARRGRVEEVRGRSGEREGEKAGEGHEEENWRRREERERMAREERVKTQRATVGFGKYCGRACEWVYIRTGSIVNGLAGKNRLTGLFWSSKNLSGWRKGGRRQRNWR